MKRLHLLVVAVALFTIGLLLGWQSSRQPTADLLSAASAAMEQPAARSLPPDDGKLRIICFGAHPDDCELRASGVAALWAAKGHHVKFVSVTNGDIGHWREAGGPLALRRKEEVQKAHKMLGIDGYVMDDHAGEL